MLPFAAIAAMLFLVFWTSLLLFYNKFKGPQHLELTPCWFPILKLPILTTGRRYSITRQRNSLNQCIKTFYQLIGTLN